MINKFKINLIGLIGIGTILLQGCSANDYLKCNSKENIDIIKKIIHQNEKTTCIITLYDIYTKSLNSETKNRTCSSTLKIKKLDKIYQTNIDYDVIKLENSNSTHKLVINNYYKIKRLFNNQIIPDIRYNEEMKIAKKAGFSNIDDYYKYQDAKKLVKEYSVKLINLIEQEKAMYKYKSNIFKSKNIYVLKNKYLTADKYRLELQKDMKKIRLNVYFKNKQNMNIKSIRAHFLFFDKNLEFIGDYSESNWWSFKLKKKNDKDEVFFWTSYNKLYNKLLKDNTSNILIYIEDINHLKLNIPIDNKLIFSLKNISKTKINETKSILLKNKKIINQSKMIK